MWPHKESEGLDMMDHFLELDSKSGKPGTSCPWSSTLLPLGQQATQLVAVLATDINDNRMFSSSQKLGKICQAEVHDSQTKTVYISCHKCNLQDWMLKLYRNWQEILHGHVVYKWPHKRENILGNTDLAVLQSTHPCHIYIFYHTHTHTTTLTILPHPHHPTIHPHRPTTHPHHPTTHHTGV